jgi:hypothetical protein
MTKFCQKVNFFVKFDDKMTKFCQKVIFLCRFRSKLMTK